jgi:hypothetical protein
MAAHNNRRFSHGFLFLRAGSGTLFILIEVPWVVYCEPAPFAIQHAAEPIKAALPISGMGFAPVNAVPHRIEIGRSGRLSSRLPTSGGWAVVYRNGTSQSAIPSRHHLVGSVLERCGCHYCASAAAWFCLSMPTVRNDCSNFTNPEAPNNNQRPSTN